MGIYVHAIDFDFFFDKANQSYFSF